MTEEATKLAGIVDGVNLSAVEAKALWKEFSEHMDEKRGDMVGYARKKSWFSVLPEYRDGKAVLIVRTTATSKGPPPVAAPPKAKPKPRPPQKPAQGAKPQPKGKPQPQQKAPQKPAQPARPATQGGQAPPKKRPT